jgi:hypothetical protein
MGFTIGQSAAFRCERSSTVRGYSVCLLHSLPNFKAHYSVRHSYRRGVLVT